MLRVKEQSALNSMIQINSMLVISSLRQEELQMTLHTRLTCSCAGHLNTAGLPMQQDVHVSCVMQHNPITKSTASHSISCMSQLT